MPMLIYRTTCYTTVLYLAVTPDELPFEQLSVSKVDRPELTFSEGKLSDLRLHCLSAGLLSAKSEIVQEEKEVEHEYPEFGMTPSEY